MGIGLGKRFSLPAPGKSKYSLKIWIWILLIASIPGMVIGASIYWFAVGQVERDLQNMHMLQIDHRAQNINDQLAYLEQNLAHWAFEPRFGESLRTIDFVRDFQETHDLTRTLLVLQGSHPLIEHVELYVQRRPQPVLFNPEYNPVADRVTRDMYRHVMTHDPTVFWSDDLELPSGTSANRRLVLVHKVPGGSPDPFGILITYLDMTRLENLLETLTPYHEGVTLLLDDDRDLLLSVSHDPRRTGLDAVLQNEVSNRKEQKGSFLYEWKGMNYAVSYGGHKRIGSRWTYVSAAPLTAVISPVVMISKGILWISGISFLLALVLSWTASRKIYSPLERLVRLLNPDKTEPWHEGDEFQYLENKWHSLTRESKQLQNRLENQLSSVKESFLLQLIQGYLYFYSNEDLRKRMEDFGWDVEGRQFRAVHVQLIGFSRLEGRFSPGDEGLVTFAAANIAEELAGSLPESAEVINFHDLSFGILVIHPNFRDIKETLIRFFEELTRAINRILKVNLTITISRRSVHVKEIPVLFEEAREAVGYRDLDHENQFFDLESPDVASDHRTIRYPFALEKEVLHALRIGDREEANRMFSAFFDELSRHGGKEITVQQGMLQLLGSIQHMMLHSGMDPNRIFRQTNMYERISQMREPEQMMKWFKNKIIRPFVEEVEERSNVQMKKTVEKVMLYMEEHYMEDLSLESCADMAGTNSYTLSKIFKRVTGKNFIDHLTDLRMEHAKRLLRETDLKMTDIAEKVGYQQSYFNRIFKKQEGVTPGRYRAMCRK